jgi:hypothetical protein
MCDNGDTPYRIDLDGNMDLERDGDDVPKRDDNEEDVQKDNEK